MKTDVRLLVITLLATLIMAFSAQAQVAATVGQSQVGSLSTLPESDLILYVNTSRIINEAMPRLLPEKELKEFREGMDQAKIFTGVDLRNVEMLVLAMRFNKPSADQVFPIPDAMILARGDFDAKALAGMAKMMSGGKLLEEKFGDHNLYLIKLSEISKEASSNPLGAAFAEIAMTTLDGNTIAVGNTSYIKAALDAVDGRGRIKPETLASAVRDPSALISASGSPLMAFAKSLGLKIIDNPDPNCMTKFGEYYLSLTMTSDSFKMNGAMNADNPNTAALMKRMLSGLIDEGKSAVTDKNAKSVFDQVKLFTEGDELHAEVSVPQEMAAKLVREMLAPSPAKAAATGTKATTKPGTRSRRSRRKT